MGIENASSFGQISSAHGQAAIGRALPDGARSIVLLGIQDHVAIRRELGLATMRDVALQLMIAASNKWPHATVEQLSYHHVVVIGSTARFDIEPIVQDIQQMLRYQTGIALLTLQSVVEDVAPDEDSLLALERVEDRFTQLLRSPFPGPNPHCSLVGNDFPAAIRNGDIYLAYQPKINLRERRIAGLEALARWDHRLLGTIPPSNFIPSIEIHGKIADFTLWTIRQSLDDYQKLLELDQCTPIYVNISGCLLSDKVFIDTACSMLRGSEHCIGFEITETSVINSPDVAIAHLKLLNNAGIRISIDDYGLGLSSLVYLKSMPAKELKIDKFFITDLTKTNKDPLIVRSTIDLAHALDMQVVAEGVETEGVLALLTAMGCDLAQGYYFGKPTSIIKAVSSLSQNSAKFNLGLLADSSRLANW